MTRPLPPYISRLPCYNTGRMKGDPDKMSWLGKLFHPTAEAQAPEEPRDLAPDIRSIEEIRTLLARAQGGTTGYAWAKDCSTVFSCIRLLSDAIASLPLKLYTELDNGDRKLADQNPLFWLLSVQPCPWMDKFSYWKFNMNCLLLRGMFLSIIIKSSNGKIIRLVPVNPASILIDSIRRDDVGNLIFPVQTGTGVREYSAKDCFFAYYETLDTIHPVTPITFAARTIHLADSSEKYGVDTLDKGAVLPGYYSTEQKLAKDTFDRLRVQLRENTMGDNSGRSPLLDQGLKFNQVSMTAEDMQMLQTRRYQKEEICGIFGVPPHLIGDTAQAKGWSTMEQTMTEFLQLSLTPYLIRIENAIRTRLIPENSWDYAKFSVGGLLRGDSTARTNFYKALYNMGAISANEMRQKEEMNSIPGGDGHYRPLNMEEI